MKLEYITSARLAERARLIGEWPGLLPELRAIVVGYLRSAGLEYLDGLYCFDRQAIDFRIKIFGPMRGVMCADNWDSMHPSYVYKDVVWTRRTLWDFLCCQQSPHVERIVRHHGKARKTIKQIRQDWRDALENALG